MHVLGPHQTGCKHMKETPPMRMPSPPRFFSRSTFAKIAIGLALLATPVMSPAASARPMDDTRTIVLSWKSTDSAEVVHRKLLRQARQACDIKSAYSMTFTRIERQCAADIMDQAIANIGSVALSRHHLGVMRSSRG